MGSTRLEQIDEADQLREEASEMLSNKEVYQAHLKLHEAYDLIN